ncbi:hypothetical protein MLD38_016141 [Melastoma candidum]|uniref:Uncharacterized protein n=1 Tax=Melastoma candidum TaxID=119954 RepID=A0ACB9RJM3_9MYRT|nr:hypothetical protein MLD38_016141 [Melastoma candidum]
MVLGRDFEAKCCVQFACSCSASLLFKSSMMLLILLSMLTEDVHTDLWYQCFRITNMVSQSASPIISKGRQFHIVSTSFKFIGDATLLLTPEEYLIHVGYTRGAALWCIGFEKVQEGVTILGDLVLKDKIFVYDIARQRIGWAPCNLTSSKDEFINASQLSGSSSHSGHHADNIILFRTTTTTCGKPGSRD